MENSGKYIRSRFLDFIKDDEDDKDDLQGVLPLIAIIAIVAAIAFGLPVVMCLLTGAYK